MKNLTHFSRFVTTWSLTTLLLLFVLSSCTDKQDETRSRYDYFVQVLPSCQEAEPYSEFRHWLETDPYSIHYLSELQANGILTNAAYTFDYKLAEVQWKDCDSVCHSLVQVRTEEGYRTYPGNLLDYDSPEPREHEVVTREIRSFTDGYDSIFVSISLTGEYEPENGNPIFEISAFSTYEDKLYRKEGFFEGQHADSTGTFLRFAYNPTEWQIRDAVHGLEAYRLDDEHNLIYIPVMDDDGNARDMYHLYRMNILFNDCYQNCIVHSPVIGHSLAGYAALVQHYYADGYYIRIDRMADSTYRYAAWSTENQPRNEMFQHIRPDIIIYNGWFDEEKQTYQFRQNEYVYQVPVIYGADHGKAGYPSSPEITVTKNGEQIKTLHIGGIPY